MSIEHRVNHGRTLVTATISEVGRRSRNEDRFGAVESGAVLGWVVCDGLGGHDSGDVAAESAVGAAVRALDTPAESLVATAEAMIRSANDAVIAARAERSGESAMASTIALAVSDGESIAWGHVGDTRIYRFRDGQPEQLTRDHSVAESMRALSSSESRDEDNRNATVLLSSLGTAEMYHDVSALEELRSGDVFLICSDGLWGAIPMRTLGSELRGAASLEAWLGRLRQRVERKRDPEQDNFTAIAFAADYKPSAARGWRGMFGWS